MGRHLNICVIFLCQYSKHIITNVIKSNSDFIFFGMQSLPSLESIYESINFPLEKK